MSRRAFLVTVFRLGNLENSQSITFWADALIGRTQKREEELFPGAKCVNAVYLASKWENQVLVLTHGSYFPHE